ncbi:hypothetical protein Poli38472_003095 [Pythium oligandrum]|uniref:Uncharacterized protein n=1 Tax=Pythium oligandrum TaxID=41045 RepID=A0A8K1C6D5_PYTOL|nr:hypothetical protein Poli38472_003095 [Pythium oligandrum]|eukprot:TMW57170.1 hypothetical protein Poli38472_003095 [Pythium oligandrum]
MTTELGDKPVLRLALGPGTYEVDKDWRIETISVPFSFGKEPRRGILERASGPRVTSPVETRLSRYPKKLTDAQRCKSEAALTPPSQLRHTRPTGTNADIAAYSNELAKSYQQLDSSVGHLQRRIASPERRAQQFERFRPPNTHTEAYRRGPGSYEHENTLHTAPQMNSTNTSGLSLDEQQELELQRLLIKSQSTSRMPFEKRVPSADKTTTFGRIKHRDMLKFMHQAGHTSTTAVEESIAPGIYETTTTTFRVKTHNLLYKDPELLKHRGKKPVKSPTKASTRSGGPSPEDARAQWRSFKQGPQLGNSSMGTKR